MHFLALGDSPGPWNVYAETPHMQAELGSSLTLQCNYDEVQNTGYLSVDWYKFIRTWSDGTPDVREKTVKSWGYVDGAEQLLPGTYAKASYQRVNVPFQHGHSIRINNVALRSEGMYACIVKPEFGEKQGHAVITVTVLCKIMHLCGELSF